MPEPEMANNTANNASLRIARAWQLHTAKKELDAAQDELATLAITITTAHLEWSEEINAAQKKLWAKVKRARDEAIEKVVTRQRLYDEVSE